VQKGGGWIGRNAPDPASPPLHACFCHSERREESNKPIYSISKMLVEIFGANNSLFKTCQTTIEFI